jgi:hypothetical protein
MIISIQTRAVKVSVEHYLASPNCPEFWCYELQTDQGTVKIFTDGPLHNLNAACRDIPSGEKHG